MLCVRPLCVLGLGLIGGSLLRAATASGRTAWGATASAEDAEAARAAGFDVPATVDDALRRAAAADALVAVAVPLTGVPAVLRAVARHAPECRLTDVVSVKRPVADAVRRIAPNTRYVGGHPMAGAAKSGWAAGRPELFAGAAWVVVTEDGMDTDTWREVVTLAIGCGAHVVPASAAEHDSAAARISHLPHVLAAVLASVGADGGSLAFSLAAGSFSDGTRVAGSRPELVRAMCEGNANALVDALDDALGRLGAARGSLASTGSLAKTIEAGHQARQEMERRRAGGPIKPVQIDVTEGSAGSALLELGRAGGRITNLVGTLAEGVLPA
jgi:prephenate dehydrogenase